jgi:hypothetical protein
MGNDNNQNLVLGNDNAIKNKNMNLSKNNSTNLVINNKYCPENDEFQKQKPARFPIVFEWEGNENNVYLTGSFCDWHQFFEMEKVEDPNNKNNYKFFLTLFLPKGAYQYKFKIDDQWKCNSNFPTCSDKNGNINNIVDLTKQKKEDGNTDFSTSYVTTGHEQKLDETKISNYSQFFDNEYTTNINNCLYTNENENTKDSPIEFNYDDLYYNFLEQKEENDNYSYKKILPLRNEFIDHFTLNKNTIEKYNDKNLITSCSFRFGFKITTIIYYKPKIKKVCNKGQ